MDVRMSFDDAAWERSDEIFDAWKRKLHQEDTLRAIGTLIIKHRGGVPEELCPPMRGAFNVCIRMKFKDGGSALIRFPCPGVSMFPEEKVRQEVATMRFLAEKTSIPVPFILHYGMTDESPHHLGPFIIMDYVEHAYTMTAALNRPDLGWEDRPILDPHVSQDRLEFVYGQMAEILLQLSQLSFPRICSLAPVDDDGDDDSGVIASRPLTFNMNDLVQLGNFPRRKLISGAYDTSSSYFEALAKMTVTHLSTQHNDAISSATDCRRKYVGRRLFQELASQGRLTHFEEDDSGPFRLFCDDLRPANVLVNDEFKIVAVIDWEYTYAAPAELTFSPPWWLVLEAPEYWPTGLQGWAEAYEPRLNTFLRVLEGKERDAIERGSLRNSSSQNPRLLSARMRESWDSGAFWVAYAARRSWAFDAIFWVFLNERFFGEGKWLGYEDRIEMLGDDSVETRGRMEAFVERKLEESRTRTLLDWEHTETMTEAAAAAPIETAAIRAPDLDEKEQANGNFF
ncbi:MAG: hypothetical protein M1837_001003 [Sclerophora amabilis]|nr:MAG: hypothetical protein M1837_001003 [Sclerophora amabilis]